MKNLLGYDCVDGKLVANEDEARIVKYIFAKQKEYTEHPPAELVNEFLEIAKAKGEILSYEEAEQRVPYSDILEYIAKEANSNSEFLEILRKSKPYQTPLRKGKIETTSSREPIVSKELWDKVQKKKNDDTK